MALLCVYRFGLFERMELSAEISEEFDFARTARAICIDQRNRGSDDGDDFLFGAVLEPSDRRSELRSRGTQVAQIVAELGGFGGGGRLARIVCLFETMMQDHFALLHHGLAVGARKECQQQDVVPELRPEALEIAWKGGL